MKKMKHSRKYPFPSIKEEIKIEMMTKIISNALIYNRHTDIKEEGTIIIQQMKLKKKTLEKDIFIVETVFRENKKENIK